MKVNKNLAIQLFKREIPALVSDACQLEGIHFTVPEVQTLMCGTSVGNKSIHEHTVAVNQINAWIQILRDLEANSINIGMDYSNKIHAIAAREDALEWNGFRSGDVTIAGTNYLPPSPGDLVDRFQEMIRDFDKIEETYHKAIFLFLHYAKNQFYYDNNKRQGRFMMNTYLLDQGFPVINVPKSRENDFNHGMIRFYDSAESDPSEMTAFMMSCLHPTIAKQFDIPIVDFESNSPTKGSEIYKI